MKKGYPHEEVLLNAEERYLVDKTFRLVRGQMTDLGVLTFLTLFKSHSNSKNYFVSIDEDCPLEDPKIREALQNHGLRLMKVNVQQWKLIWVPYIVTLLITHRF